MRKHGPVIRARVRARTEILDQRLRDLLTQIDCPTEARYLADVVADWEHAAYSRLLQLAMPGDRRAGEGR